MPWPWVEIINLGSFIINVITMMTTFFLVGLSILALEYS